MIASSTMTSKGQITIPKEIRNALKIEPGHRIEFEISGAGTIVMRARSGDFRRLRGMIRSPHTRPVPIREMDPEVPDRPVRK